MLHFSLESAEDRSSSNPNSNQAKDKGLWQRFAAMFSTYFAYHPYGDNLLSDRARVFFLWMLLLTIATAGLEAYTWFQLIAGDPAYQKLTLSDSGYFLPWILAAGVFVSAWMIDSSIVLLSTDSLVRWEKQAGIKSKDQTNISVVVDWLTDNLWTLFIQYVPRTLLFLFTVAAVGLGSIVTKERASLERESVAALSTQIDAALFAKKTELEINAGIPALLNEIKQLDDERIQEIAGRVGSGKLGNGPTAQAMAVNIQSKNTQLRAAQTAVNVQYLTIENAAVKLKTGQYDATELNKLSALGFTVQDPKSNTAVIMRLLERFTGGKDKDGKSKETSVPWYIHLLNFLFSMHGAILLPFLAMLISKLFQPEAARIYLSEELQGAWKTVQGIDVDRLPIHLPVAAGLAKAKSANMTEFATFWYPFKSAIKHIYGRAESEGVIAYIITATQNSPRIVEETRKLKEASQLLSDQIKLEEVELEKTEAKKTDADERLPELKRKMGSLDLETEKEEINATAQAINGFSKSDEYKSLDSKLRLQAMVITEKKVRLATINNDLVEAEHQSKNPEIKLVLEKVWNYLTKFNSEDGNNKDAAEMDLKALTEEVSDIQIEKARTHRLIAECSSAGQEKAIQTHTDDLKRLVTKEEQVKQRKLQLEKRLLVYKETALNSSFKAT